MADQKVSAMTNLPQAQIDVSADEIMIVDASVPLSKRVYPNDLVKAVLAGPGPIGSGTPSTGNFTSLTATDLTVNGNATITGTVTAAVPAGTLTGATLASNVVNASLNAITPSGGTLAVTGTSTASSGFSLVSTNGFGDMRLLQAAGGTGWRHTLNNDGTLLVQRTTNGFTSATTFGTWSISGLAITGALSIGTTSLQRKLTINGGANDEGIRIDNGSGWRLDLLAAESGNSITSVDSQPLNVKIGTTTRLAVTA